LRAPGNLPRYESRVTGRGSCPDSTPARHSVVAVFGPLLRLHPWRPGRPM